MEDSERKAVMYCNLDYRIVFDNKAYKLSGFRMYNPIVENHINCLYLAPLVTLVGGQEGESITWEG